MAKKKRFLILLAALSILPCPAFHAYAQDSTVRIGANNLPPFAWPLDNNEITGFATELLRGAFHILKVDNTEIELYPWSRGINMLKEGKLHALYPIAKNRGREAVIYYPEEPFCHSEWVFFIRKNDAGKLKFDSFDDLKGKRIGLTRDYKYTPALWAFVKKENNYELVTVEEQNFRKLMGKRIDYVISEYMVGMHLSKKLGIRDGITALRENPIESIPLYVGFSKKAVKEEFVDKFSGALKIFKSDSYEQLLYKYTGN